ncbi:MAG: hypothetical protein WC511_04915 [Candidatus Pacearchaeota archaeon]
MLEEDVQEELKKVDNAIVSLQVMQVKYKDILPKNAFNPEIVQLKELKNRYEETLYPNC